MNSNRYHSLCFYVFGLPLVACAARSSDHAQPRYAWDRMQQDRVQAQRDQLAPDADLEQLLSYARANHPGLEAAFERWKEALEKVPQAKTLPNPRLSFSAYLSKVETRVGPMQARVSLTQPFPWFGSLELAGDIAFEAAEASRELLEAARLELEQRVRDAWYEYAWVGQALVISEGNRELLTHWESVARARMETGLSSHADVIRAQVELGKLEDRVQTLSDMRRPLRAKLNTALGRAAGAPLPEPKFPLAKPPVVDEELLAVQLVRTSPVLRALEHRIAAAEHGVDLADKAFYPNLFVGADYAFIGSAQAPGIAGSGDDAVALTLGFDLPIWRASYSAAARAAEARKRSARKEHEDAHNQLSSDLELALYRLRDANRRVALFRDSLIPKGEEAVQALDSAYQSGDEGFLDLIDAQRVLLEFQLQAARAEADRCKSSAEIERISGTSLSNGA